MSHETLRRVAAWTTKGILLASSACAFTDRIPTATPISTPTLVVTVDMPPTKPPEPSPTSSCNFQTDLLRPDEIREIMRVNFQTFGVKRLPVSQDFIDAGGCFVDFQNSNRLTSLVGIFPPGKSVTFPSLTDGEVGMISHDPRKPYITTVTVVSKAKATEGDLIIYAISGASVPLVLPKNDVSIGSPFLVLNSKVLTLEERTLQNNFQIEGDFPENTVISITRQPKGGQQGLTFKDNILRANGKLISVATIK